MTNQASEDELTKIIDEVYLFGMNGGLGYEKFDNELSPNDAKAAINALIRTEKLKLLAEVRERVVGESFKPSGFDERYSRQEGDNGHITHYETKKDADTINQHQEYQRTELTKLEAEL